MVKLPHYCGGPSVRVGSWIAASWKSGFPALNWPQLAGRTVIGTFKGRSAISLACRLLGIGPGNEVLVPAYNCGTEVDALLSSGAHTIGFPISRHCDYAIEDIAARRTSRTKAVYVIHYFGWEQDGRELRRWCDDNGLLLIEDCALAMFSDGQHGSIGRLGDAAIYSLPKTFGSLHGGLLSLSSSRADAGPGLARVGATTLLQEVRHSSKDTALRILDRLGLYGPLMAMRTRAATGSIPSNDAHPDMPQDYYYQPEEDENRGLHPCARLVASAHPWEETCRLRREHYSRLLATLRGMDGVSPLFPDLPEGVCPLSLPLLVANRDVLVDRLERAGIAACPWWAGFHQSGIDWPQFPDACWLKRNLLTLPVHQSLDELHLEYIAETFVRILRLSA